MRMTCDWGARAAPCRPLNNPYLSKEQAKNEPKARTFSTISAAASPWRGSIAPPAGTKDGFSLCQPLPFKGSLGIKKGVLRPVQPHKIRLGFHHFHGILKVGRVVGFQQKLRARLQHTHEARKKLRVMKQAALVVLLLGPRIGTKEMQAGYAGGPQHPSQGVAALEAQHPWRSSDGARRCGVKFWRCAPAAAPHLGNSFRGDAPPSLPGKTRHRSQDRSPVVCPYQETIRPSPKRGSNPKGQRWPTWWGLECALQKSTQAITPECFFRSVK